VPVTININDLTLAHKASTGMAAATIPDVCKTPTPGGPVPVPYPNIVVSADLVKGTVTVIVDGGNMAAIKGSELFKSTGDEPGVAGGVTSSTFIKEASWLLYSFDVMFEGKNACRLTDKLFMNHENTVCLGGWIQDTFFANSRNKNKSQADACLALFELIMEMLDGGSNQKYWKGRGLDGGDGRFNQNKTGGGLGPKGAPNAPRNHPPVPGYPEGANDWETHDSEIMKQQNELNERLEEFDDECGGGSRQQQKDVERAREAAKRPRPKKEEWEGPKWEPEPEPAAQSSELSSGQKVLIVVGVLVVLGGIALALPSGGTSLAASAAGVALIVGAAGTTGPPATSPSGA
jgi:hypothetical protein